jgi:hypothetical protein
MLLPLLIIGVVAAGGPLQHGQRDRGLIGNADVEVATVAGEVIATSRVGNIQLRLPVGRYRVTASLGPPNVTPGRQCASRTLLVNRTHRPTSVTLYCSIK